MYESLLTYIETKNMIKEAGLAQTVSNAITSATKTISGAKVNSVKKAIGETKGRLASAAAANDKAAIAKNLDLAGKQTNALATARLKRDGARAAVGVAGVGTAKAVFGSNDKQ